MCLHGHSAMQGPKCGTAYQHSTVLGCTGALVRQRRVEYDEAGIGIRNLCFGETVNNPLS